MVQGNKKKPMKGTNQLSKARLSRSLKRNSAKSARRGEIRAKRTTKQPMRSRYPFGAAAFKYGRIVSADSNKDLVRRFYREAINERDSGACERLLSEDFVHNGEPRGRTGQRQAVNYFLAAFPDLHNEIELILAEDDLVAAHQRWSGTHSDEFLGVEATGRRVEFSSTALLRIRDGLIARAWDEMDAAAIVKQLSG